VRHSFTQHINRCFAAGFGREKLDERLFLRMYDVTPGASVDVLTMQDNYVRAILTPKYAPFANMKALTLLRSALDALDQDGANFRLWELSQSMDRLWLRVVNFDKKMRDGDDEVYPGVNIGNAEDGTRQIVVEPFIGKGFCINGLIFGEQEKEGVFKRRHIGNVEITDHRFRLALADAFLMADRNMEHFLGLQDKSVEDPLKVVARVCKAKSGKPGFTKAFEQVAQGVLPMYRTRYGDTMYAVVNSLTQAAQSLNDEDQVAVERELGKLVAA
jgi:hypothetical protein